MAKSRLDARNTPEQWSAVSDFPDYEVSTHGNVRRRSLKPKLNMHGYPCVTLCGPGIRKNRAVHRLVAETFIPRPDGCEFVHHINHDKADAHVSNLEWVTPSENSTRAVAAGRYPVFDRAGSANGNSKLNEQQIRRIRSLFDGGTSVTTIGARFGIDRQHAWAIGTRKIWKHLPD